MIWVGLYWIFWGVSGRIGVNLNLGLVGIKLYVIDVGDGKFVLGYGGFVLIKLSLILKQ